MTTVVRLLDKYKNCMYLFVFHSDWSRNTLEYLSVLSRKLPEILRDWWQIPATERLLPSDSNMAPRRAKELPRGTPSLLHGLWWETVNSKQESFLRPCLPQVISLLPHSLLQPSWPLKCLVESLTSCRLQTVSALCEEDGWLHADRTVSGVPFPLSDFGLYASF